jgi:ATP-dependent Clp protease ATP-binding subunit ClpB
MCIALPFPRKLTGDVAVLNHERLTLKAGEAIQTAVAEASRRGNPALEDIHLLWALLGQEETVVLPILQKVGVNAARLREALRQALERLPKQSGGSQPAASRS